MRGQCLEGWILPVALLDVWVYLSPRATCRCVVHGV